jgi:KRAB domain-containing zinc finger protein
MKSYKCPYSSCIKVYKGKKTLKNHIRIEHTQKVEFVCSYCSRTLSSKQTLKEHENKHTGEEPYECEFC